MIKSQILIPSLASEYVPSGSLSVFNTHGVFEDFKNRIVGPLDGQGDWRRYGGTAIVNSDKELELDAFYQTNSKGIMSQRLFGDGIIRMLVKKGADSSGYFILGFRYNLTNDSRYILAVSRTGHDIRLGYAVGTSVSYKTGTGLVPIPEEDFWVEIVCPTISTGATISAKIWGVSQTKPSSPSLTWTLAAGDVLYEEGYVNIGTTNPDGLPAICKIKQIEILDGEYYHNPYLDQAEWIGRWIPRLVNGKGVMSCNSQGFEIRSVVEGTTKVQATFINESTLDHRLAVSVDGGPYSIVTVPVGENTVTLASGLNPSIQHTIRTVVSGIYVTEPVWEKGMGVNFLGYTLDAGGKAYPWKSKQKRILFIGDSITQGKKILGTGDTPTDGAGELCYAHIAADLLNAIPWQVGYGGTGILQNGSGGVPKVSQTFDYAMARRPVREPKPDVICINHGTNDWSFPSEEFVPAYEAFIDQVRARYPNVPIFLIRPFNGQHGADVQTVAANKGCYFVDTTGWNPTTTDGTHPDIAGHQLCGQNLANYILSVLGSDFFN